MLTSYKFSRIRREDDGHISECDIRFYEGVVTTENEMDNMGNMSPVTRYRHTGKLKKRDMPHMANRKFIKEKVAGECILYTSEDFGTISTDDELRDFLDEELFKDESRDPIPEQDKRILNKPKR